jgi:hypothetical protein
LLNLQLLQDGYAPAFLPREWKLRYLEACAAVPDEQYQPLSDLALSSGYDTNDLGLLARTGMMLTHILQKAVRIAWQ